MTGPREAPPVPVALGIVRRRTRLHEPGVRRTGVVDDEVHHQLHAPRVQLRDQLVELLEGAEERVDVVVVGNVVAVVGHRRAVDRTQPDDVDTEQLEVVEMVQDSAEVADAVTVAVGEAARVDLIDHRGLPPVAPSDRGRMCIGVLGQRVTPTSPRPCTTFIRNSRP